MYIAFWSSGNGGRQEIPVRHGQLSALAKLGGALQEHHKPLDAVTASKTLAAAEPDKRCHLFIVHAKFFNVAKDPFAAAIFKALEVHPFPLGPSLTPPLLPLRSNSASKLTTAASRAAAVQGSKTACFAIGKEKELSGIGKKYHWWMGEDGDWDIPAALKHVNNILDGKFTEAGFHGPPAYGRKPSMDAGMGGMMGMGGSMMGGGMMGSSMGGMGGPMGGMGGPMGGMPMGGPMNGMGSTMGGMGGPMGMANTQMGTMGSMGGPMGMSGTMASMAAGMGGSMTGGMNAMGSLGGPIGGGMEANMIGSGSLGAPLGSPTAMQPAGMQPIGAPMAPMGTSMAGAMPVDDPCCYCCSLRCTPCSHRQPCV